MTTLVTPERKLVDPRTLTDPPELKRHAARGDPPVNEWPGRIMNRIDVMRAAGDQRDWFRYWHRQKAVERVTYAYRKRRKTRRKLGSGYDWNQVLILGDYGAKKTTLGIYAALLDFVWGHAAFHNASCLFGWRLDREETYTSLGLMPKYSSLLVDEASAALPSRLGSSIPVISFAEMCLNIRKQACRVYFMSAQDWQIAPTILRDCKEVWMPVKDADLEVVDEGGPPVDPANDPSNFRLVWHVWDDFPYRKGNMIEEDPKDRKRAFGPPAYTMYAEGELVRLAYLCNDTFELAAAGSATTAERSDIREDLDAFDAYRRGSGRRRVGRGDADATDLETQLFAFFLERRAELEQQEYVTAGEVASVVDAGSSRVGQLIQEVFAVKSRRNYGYLTAAVYERIDALMGEAA